MDWVHDLDEIYWLMDEPSSKAYVFDENFKGKDKKRTQNILDKKLPIKKGDRIVYFFSF